MIELSRLGCVELAFVVSAIGGNCSISVVEKERLREGERKEFGETEGRWWLGGG